MFVDECKDAAALNHFRLGCLPDTSTKPLHFVQSRSQNAQKYQRLIVITPKLVYPNLVLIKKSPNMN